MPTPLDRFSKAVPSDTPFLEEKRGCHEPVLRRAWLPTCRLPGDWRAVQRGHRAGDSQAEGQGAFIQVDQTADNVPCCPSLA